MRWFRQWLARRTLERDLTEEIRQHLDEKVDDLVADGLSREQAIRQAHREFGNVTLLEERGREVWRWHLIEDCAADLRYAGRQLRRAPGFALAAIVTLALGIGATTAMFTVVNAVVLRPLPFPAAERLVSVASRDRRGPEPSDLSYPTFFDFRSKATVFERIASARGGDLTLTGRGLPVQLRGQIVSWDFFQTLGVEPVHGRGFLADEEEPGVRVVILSHDTWTNVFGADPALVGQRVMLDGEPNIVVGIAPAGFSFPPGRPPVQIWTTLARDASSAPTATPVTRQRGARMLNAIARLAPGVSREQAQAQLDVIAAAIARDNPDQNKNIDSTYVRPALETLLGRSRDALLILWGAVSLLLLIACANVASLLLARTTDREREFALRMAIGGSRGRIVRQLVTENLLLAGAGCAAGIGVAVFAVRSLLPLAADGLARIDDVRTDTRVLIFSVGLALITTLLISGPAAMRVARGGFGGPLGKGSGGATEDHHRARGTFVITQIAVSLILLAGATGLMTSFVRLMERDLGFEPRHLMTFDISLPSVHYPIDRQVQFVDALVERLRAVPGVTAAAAGMPLPLEGSQMRVAFNIEERPSAPSERPRANMAIVTPGYFASIGTPVVAGRDFTPQDDEGHSRVLIVNQAFADRFFPGESAVGQRIEPGASSTRDKGSRVREIVGVAGNARQTVIAQSSEPIYYFPYKQLPWGAPSLVIRSTEPLTTLEPTFRRIVSDMDGQVAVHDVRTFDEAFASAMAAPQLLVLLIGSVALIALLLTATGLYGLLSYAVLRRKREIGVRVALGAPGSAIVAMIVRQALRLAVIGMLMGSLGSIAVDTLLRNQLGVDGPPLAMLLTLACGLVALTAASASYVPARRAAAIDPTEALRNE
jgi:putative ABC transport system permease protein